MSIKTDEELSKLKVVGKIVRKALDTMAAAVRIGITTAELDQIGATTLTEYGAEAAPPKVYGFPGQCASASMTKPFTGFPGAAPYATATW